jgi:hypothetical protein
VIDDFHNNDYVFMKKSWYRRINYIVNLINHINGQINLIYIDQKAYNIVKNEIENNNIIINYKNIRKILKINRYGT